MEREDFLGGCLVFLAGKQADRTPSFAFTLSRERAEEAGHSFQSTENRTKT
jgi:hypothetical protein